MSLHRGEGDAHVRIAPERFAVAAESGQLFEERQRKGCRHGVPEIALTHAATLAAAFVLRHAQYSPQARMSQYAIAWLMTGFAMHSLVRQPAAVRR